MLNRSFERWIQETVGDAEYRKLKNTDGYQTAMQQFDLTIKPAFRSEKDRDRYLSFPMANLKDNHSKGIVRNSIKLKGSVIFAKNLLYVAYISMTELPCSTYSVLSSRTSTDSSLNKFTKFELDV